MQAARIKDKGVVELVEFDKPVPGPGEALLRVSCCGICGSDLHSYRGQWKAGAGVGHEFCAMVEQVGADVGGLGNGMRVVGECFAHCGDCDQCRRGDYNHCDSISWLPARPAGAMAEWMVYPAGSLLPVPDSLSDEQAVMVEPVAVAFRAVSRARVQEGETVAVVGGGTIGLLCAAAASARGASQVFLIAKHEHQAGKARELGIATPLLPAQGDPRQITREQAGGRGVDVAIDSVAAGTSLSTALSVVARQGRVVEVGGITRPLMVALNPLVSGEVQMTGASCYAMTEGRRDFEWAIELIADGRVKAEALITHTFPLAQVGEAFQTAADKKTGSIKVVVEPGA